MSVDLRLPFGKFLRLAMIEYRNQCEGGKMSAQMAEEQIERCHEAWHRAHNPKPARTNFLPPTPAEVEKYAQEIGYPLDGVAWCLHYEVKGWHTGNAKMRNWQAAVRNWKRNGWHTKITPAGAPPPSLQEPPGWKEFMRKNYPDWVEFRDERPLTWERLHPQSRQTVIELMRKDADERGT